MRAAGRPFAVHSGHSTSIPKIEQFCRANDGRVVLRDSEGPAELDLCGPASSAFLRHGRRRGAPVRRPRVQSAPLFPVPVRRRGASLEQRITEKREFFWHSSIEIPDSRVCWRCLARGPGSLKPVGIAGLSGHPRRTVSGVSSLPEHSSQFLLRSNAPPL